MTLITSTSLGHTMASLTPASDCISCRLLSQKVAELHGRVSMLQQIKEDEILLDSMMCPASPTSAPGLDPSESDLEIQIGPAAPATVSQEERALDMTVPMALRTAAAPVMSTEATRNDNVPMPSAQPRLCSTPLPWSTVSRRKDKNKTHPRSKPLNPSVHAALIPTSNRYSLLDLNDFPTLPPRPLGGAPPHNSLDPVEKSNDRGSGRKRGQHPLSDRRNLLRLAVNSTSVGRRPHGSPTAPHQASARDQPRVPVPTASGSTQSSAQQPPPATMTPTPPSRVPPTPSLLIVSDSILRNVQLPFAISQCFPGATVPTLLKKLPGVIHSLPPSIKMILVHVGTNDSAQCTSEQTKDAFLHLFALLNNSGLTFFISGPIPTFLRSDESFSRIASLNTWLLRFCLNNNFNFIDNFNLFWGRALFFKNDGLHPNRLGSKMLAGNLSRGISHYTVLPTNELSVC